MYKVIIHLNNNSKAVVFTCNTNKSNLEKQIINFLKDEDLNTLQFPNGDVFICTNKNNINNIVITTTDKKDD